MLDPGIFVILGFTVAAFALRTYFTRRVRSNYRPKYDDDPEPTSTPEQPATPEPAETQPTRRRAAYGAARARTALKGEDTETDPND